MTNHLVNRLRSLAGTLANSDQAKALYTVAEDVEHKLEVWSSSVDAWVETHFAAAEANARQDAGADYRAAVVEAHKLMDEVKAKL